MRASVLEEDLSHREVNERSAEDGRYTRAVESFLGSLDQSVARMLIPPPEPPRKTFPTSGR
jgi:arylformamidase